MNQRTKGIVACCAAMMAGGFTHFQLAHSSLADSAVLKAGVVGLVAGLVLLVLLMLITRGKAA